MPGILQRKHARRAAIGLLLVCAGWGGLAAIASSRDSRTPTQAVASADLDESWMRVTLEGRKIGHLHATREVQGDRVITTSTTRFDVDRAGTPLVFESVERHTETVAGKPLAFETRTQISGMENSVRGRAGVDGRWSIEQEVGGKTEKRSMQWPQGALLSEGSLLRQKAAGLTPGTTVEISTFLPDAMAAATARQKVIGRERVMLVGRTVSLMRVEQSINVGGAVIQGTVWVDREHNPRRVRLPLLGVSMEMLDCDRACALAPNQPSDVLSRTLVPAPKSLETASLADPIRYHIRLRESAGDTQLADTSEQRVRPLSGLPREWEVSIGLSRSGSSESPPVPADTQPTSWLQSDDADVEALANKSIGDATDAGERMQRLEASVRRHITDKTLAVGYASAAETVQSRAGDCTEHALLLAATARSIGIPARVVNGLAFTRSFGERRHVFVPHAWTQAWIDGRWKSYDAALQGFDSGHIAFSSGNGDPITFYQSVSLLGATEIIAATPVSATPAAGSSR